MMHCLALKPKTLKQPFGVVWTVLNVLSLYGLIVELVLTKIKAQLHIQTE